MFLGFMVWRVIFHELVAKRKNNVAKRDEDEQATFNVRVMYAESVLQDQEIIQKIKAALYPTELAKEMK